MSSYEIKVISINVLLNITIINVSRPISSPKASHLFLQSTVANSDLSSSRINPTKLNSLVVGKSVHRRGRNVEARSSVVDGQDVDALALVGKLPARAAALGVPASDGLRASNVRKLGDLALSLPAVARDEAVCAVGAGDGCHGAASFAVAWVVGY